MNMTSNKACPACLSVVMPVYNEENTIDQIIRLVLSQEPVAELIIVEDCSKDATWSKLEPWPARDPRVRLFRHPVNQGKGAALRTGLAKATSPYVLIQDADMEYDPTEYYVLLGPLLQDRADVVFGSRFAGGAHRVLYYWHSVGNRLLTTLSNMCTNLGLTDMETCYKAFRLDVIQRISIEENRFGFEPEITAKLLRAGHHIHEVPVRFEPRSRAQGKKIGWRDGVNAIDVLLRHRFL